MKREQSISEGDFIYIPSDNTIRQVMTKESDSFGTSIVTDHGETKDIQEVELLNGDNCNINDIEISSETRIRLNLRQDLLEEMSWE